MSPPNIYNPSLKQKYISYHISSNLLISPSISIYSPFCDVLPKGNQDSSEGGADGETPPATAKSTRKVKTSFEQIQ